MSNLAQTSFNAGAITEKLDGQTDFDKRGKGVRICKNAFPIPHGPITRRPGTYYVNATKNSGAAALIAFEFNVEQAYILEFGNLYMRVFKDGGVVETTPGSGTSYEIDTPYQAAHVGELKIAQSADTLFIVHPFYAPRKLTRADHNDWTLAEISFTARPSDWSPATDAPDGITLPSGTPVSINATAHGLSTGAVVSFSDVEGTTELNGNSYYITRTDADNYTLDDTDGDDFTAYTSGGTIDVYDQPACMTLFEGRSVWGGLPSNPHKLYFSQINDYEDMTTGTDDDDGFVAEMANGRVNAARWIVAKSKLFIGTNGGEAWMSGAGTDAPITPTSRVIRYPTNFGTVNAAPAVIDSDVVFIQRPGKKLRKMQFDLVSDTYKGVDLSILGEHLTKNYAITQVAYSQTPYQIVWAVRADGALLSLTYHPEHEVYGWAEHEIGGEDVEVESIAVIPGDTRDELWMIVKRTIDSATVRYVEQMQGDDWAFTFEAVEIETTTTASASSIETESDEWASFDAHDEALDFETGDSETVNLGNTTQYDGEICLLYENLGIPSGAVITSARIKFTAPSGYGGPANLRLYYYLNDTVSPVMPTSWAEYDALSLGNKMRWATTLTLGSGETAYCPQFGDVLNEHIQKPGWNENSDLMVVFKIDTSTTVQFLIATQDNQTYDGPTLEITYFDSADGANGIVTAQTRSSGADVTIDVDHTDFEDTNVGVSIGLSYGDYYHGLLYFKTAVPQGAQITDCYIWLYEYGTTSNAEAKIRVADMAPAVMPTDWAGYAALSYLGSSDMWYLGDKNETSPSFVDQLQALVDDEDYDGGVVIKIEAQASSPGTYGAESYDYNPAASPTLNVSFTTPADETVTMTVAYQTAEDAFYVDSGLSYESDAVAITGITNADPGVVTASGHGLSNDDYITIYGVSGMTEINAATYKVAGVSGDTFQLNDEDGNDFSTAGFAAYASGGYLKQKVTGLSGLSHLNGETVQVFADGAVQAEKTVAAGEITLESPAAVVHVGLGYTTDIETLNMEPAGSPAITQDLVRSISRLLVRVFESVGFKCGPDADNLDEFASEDQDHYLGETIAKLFTGDIEVELSDKWEQTSSVFFRVDDPVPFTLSGIFGRLHTEE
jgi:hypothetical protein